MLSFQYLLSALHPHDPYEDTVEDLKHAHAGWSDSLAFHETNLKEIEGMRKRPSGTSGVMVKVASTHGDTWVRRRSKKAQPETYVLSSCPDMPFADPNAQFLAELREWQEATYRIASINTALAYINLSKSTPSGSRDSALTLQILNAMLKDVEAFPLPPPYPFMLAPLRPDDRNTVDNPTRIIFDEPHLSETIAGLDVGSRDYLGNVAKKIRQNGPALPKFLARRDLQPTTEKLDGNMATKMVTE